MLDNHLNMYTDVLNGPTARSPDQQSGVFFGIYGMDDENAACLVSATQTMTRCSIMSTIQSCSSTTNLRLSVAEPVFYAFAPRPWQCQSYAKPKSD